MIKRENAPVDLKGLNEITSSKEFEHKQSGNMNLRDILNTPEQLNSKRGMIMRCTGIRKALGKKKRLCSIPKLELNPSEKENK